MTKQWLGVKKTESVGKPILKKITKNNMNDEQIIKNLQYRKNLSIAFFNATNAAIELVKTDYVKDTDLKKFIVGWRDFFLEEHKNYYASVIENIGLNFNVDETIAKLRSAKNSDELKGVWISLSEDERQNEEIINVKNELKKSYEEI